MFYNVKETYPNPNGKAGKFIDSKVIDLMGYVSSQEGKVNKIYIRIII